jgi:molybdate transport system regulatory protein
VTLSTRLRKPKRPPRSKATVARPFPRLRILFGEGLILGPGKVELLEAIDRTGSISAAGREMGMSYRRAWLLVDALNRMFARPLVVASTGGSGGGGATITDLGRDIAAAYRRAEERSLSAIEEELGPFQQTVKSKK